MKLHQIKYKQFFALLFVFTSLFLTINGCSSDETAPLSPGKIVFSFKSLADGGARTQTGAVPAFVYYTIESADGTTTTQKVELIGLGNGYVTAPQTMSVGHKTLTEFLVLAADNSTIYASPKVESEMAKYVERPLPIDLDVTAENTTEVIPEVLAVNSDTPGEQFGYATFSFQVVDLLAFNVHATIAENTTYDNVDYSMEIVAKDGPGGTVQWTDVVQLHEVDQIKIPAQYNHFTFTAIRDGYISHIQHYQKSELPQDEKLYFEFIPENLNGFIKKDLANGATAYFPNLSNRCKLYTRLDLPEGYSPEYIRIDKGATSLGGTVLAPVAAKELYSAQLKTTATWRINLFGQSFGESDDFCSTIRLVWPTKTYNLQNDVKIESFLYAESYSGSFATAFMTWTGPN